jgi:AAA+ superfamily predicted ATPase
MTDPWMTSRLNEASRAVMDLSLREALARGSNFIEPEDIERAIRRHRQRVAEAEERAKGVGG